MLVEPQHIIFDCYKRLLVQKEGKQVSLEVKEILDGISIQDEMFSDYPCMLIKNKLIHKGNINSFLKQVFDINQTFSNEKDRGQIERLETLCMT